MAQQERIEMIASCRYCLGLFETSEEIANEPTWVSPLSGPICGRCIEEMVQDPAKSTPKLARVADVTYEDDDNG